MAANISIKCPMEGCPYQAMLRFDPGPENGAPTQAAIELENEHPYHEANASWRFRKADNSTGIDLD